MSAEPELGWYVAQLKPNAAVLAERNLVRQGYHTFMPMIERDERKAPGFTRRLRPLFPGYLFVGFDPLGGAWRSISGTRGIARLVTFGNAIPRPVSGELLQHIRSHTDPDGVFRTHQNLGLGDTVVILTGPLTDLVARIHSLEDAGRAWVLLDFLGQETRVQMRREQLARA